MGIVFRALAVVRARVELVAEQRVPVDILQALGQFLLFLEPLLPLAQVLIPFFAQIDVLFKQRIEVDLILDLLRQIKGGHLQHPQRLDELRGQLLIEAQAVILLGAKHWINSSPCREKSQDASAARA